MSVSNYKSYPPLLRPSGTHSISSNKGPPLNSHDPLLVMDLNNIDLQKLEEACIDWGMFRVVNHGIPDTLLNELEGHAKKIFSISYESKKNMFTGPPMSYFWGTPALTPSGKAFENLQKSGKFNFLEGIQIYLTGLSNIVCEDAMVEHFRTLLREYGNHMGRIAKKIFEAMALNLKLDATQTKTYFSEATGLSRVLRYPCCLDGSASDDHQTWGIDTHTDSNTLTILHQDQVGGLQILSKDDQWFDAPPVSDSLIINLGDLMKAMSDDKYISVKHRVKANKVKERISVGYFVFPCDDTVIKSSKFKPFTYPEFRAQVQQDLKTIGYKCALPKFRLVEDF